LPFKLGALGGLYLPFLFMELFTLFQMQGGMNMDTGLSLKQDG